MAEGYISSIKLPDNKEYLLKDSNAATSDHNHHSDNTLMHGYTRAQIGTSPNYDNPQYDNKKINGIYEIRTASEVSGETGNRPAAGFYPMLSLQVENVMMQLGGINSQGWFIRGKQAANVTLADVAWQKLITDTNYKSYAWARPTTITAGQVLISNGTTGETTLRGIVNLTSKSTIGWEGTSADAANTYLVTRNAIAYWNGAFKGTNSNLSILGTVTTGTWHATTIEASYIDAAIARLDSPPLTGTPTAPTAANGTSTTQIATTEFVNNTLSYINAMTFKGTLGTGGTVTALPASHQAGDTYRVKTAGTWAGEYCEVGTLIICVKDGTTATDTDWTSVETNEDGAVIGPTSSTGNNIVTFSGTTGRIIQDSEKAFSTATPSSSSTDDQIPTAKAVWAVIDGLDGNLNSTTPGAEKTLTAFSQTNGKVSATFGNISITKSQVSDFSHAHGNLTNDGKITSTATIANGDKLVIVDSDASSKIIGATITFDGTTETKALTPKGTWVTFNNYSHPTSAGNKHIPSGGAAGQFLAYGNSSGTAAWSDLPVASTSTAGIIKIGTAATNAMAGNTVVNTVKQSPAPTSNNDEYPILLKTTANTNEETGTIKFSEPTITPKTGRLSATSFMVDSHVTLRWNSTDSSLDFIFV